MAPKLENEFRSFLPSDDTHPYRTGAWRPQSREWTDVDPVIEGELPTDLNGVYLRNCENPLVPNRERYHPFDGDGMIHSISFREGHVEYRNRFVRTDGMLAEQDAGRALWSGLAESPKKSEREDGWGARTRMKDASSTDVVVHRGVALSSFYQCGDLYRLDPVTLADLGKESWNGTFPAAGASAHTKVDEATGDLFFFNYGTTAPFMHYGVVDRNGELVTYEPIELPGARLPHDMCFTQNYAVLNDCPLFWDPDLLPKGVYANRFYEDLPMRLGVIPRNGRGSDIRWFDFDPTFVLHWMNAWEDGDWVIVDGYFQQDPAPTLPADATVDQRLFRYLDLYAMQSIPYRWQMNMRTGETKEGPLSDIITEFGMINASVMGRPYRWAYSALPTEGWFTFEGIIKHDVHSGSMQTYRFPNGTYCSETVFAPRPGATSEDDGYLLTYTSDIVNDESHCMVFDAQNPGDGPIARVRLPERICSGTHAYWADAATLTPA